MEQQGSLESVVAEFSRRVAELREATLLRVDGGCGRAVVPIFPGWLRFLPLHVGNNLIHSRTCVLNYSHRPCPPCADTTRQLYAHDLEAVDATLRALELKLRDIRAFVKREKEAIPQAEAAVAACQLQRAHLQHISNHLPAFLPSLDSPAPSGAAGGGSKAAAALDKENAAREAAGNAPPDAAARSRKKLAKR